jgi:hypothetical protein
MALKKHEQMILHQQIINDKDPGTIVHDFATLLDFIGSEGMQTSGKHHFLPMQRLAELNARLIKPVALGLKRPQQKSYPHIHGLYLLLRASGLGLRERHGRRHYLKLDRQGMSSWNDLNPTERYFSLLESWILRGNPEILVEHGYFASGSIGKWPDFFQRIPKRGLKISGDKEAESRIRYIPTLCTLALLELFGMVKVTHAKPEPGKAWQIDRIQRTAFGDAMLRLLHEEDIFLSLMFNAEIEDGISRHLREKLIPFFPEWKRSIELSEQEQKEGIYVFKVYLGSTWARIAIPSGNTLDELSDSILDAFEFDYDHLYQFTYKNRYGIPAHINHPYMEDPPFASEVTIRDIALTPGSTMSYLYDFGDNWQFDIVLESIDPCADSLKHAELMEFHGEAPAQYGYEDDL